MAIYKCYGVALWEVRHLFGTILFLLVLFKSTQFYGSGNKCVLSTVGRKTSTWPT